MGFRFIYGVMPCPLLLNAREIRILHGGAYLEGSGWLWSLVPGPWSLVPGPWSLVPGPWSLVPGPWPLVPGPWSLVPGLVPGPWSLVPGPWSLVPGPKPRALGPGPQGDESQIKILTFSVFWMFDLV